VCVIPNLRQSFAKVIIQDTVWPASTAYLKSRLHCTYIINSLLNIKSIGASSKHIKLTLQLLKTQKYDTKIHTQAAKSINFCWQSDFFNKSIFFRSFFQSKSCMQGLICVNCGADAPKLYTVYEKDVIKLATCVCFLLGAH
jgi:hypothetical protein